MENKIKFNKKQEKMYTKYYFGCDEELKEIYLGKKRRQSQSEEAQLWLRPNRWFVFVETMSKKIVAFLKENYEIKIIGWYYSIFQYFLLQDNFVNLTITQTTDTPKNIYVGRIVK